MLTEFLGWWTQQMRDLVPHRLARRDRPADALLVRSLGGLQVELATRRRGVEAPFARATLDEAGLRAARAALGRLRRPGPVVLALPEPMLLEQEASLPLAAERNLHPVLRHEMDRLTPFRAEDLFWSWEVERRDVANARLALRLAFVPKAGVRALLAGLGQAALRPAWIEVASGGRLRRIGLASPGEGRGSRRSLAAVAWACAGLAVAALVAPVVRQQRAISSVEARIEALAPGVAVVDRLRRRLQASAGGADMFAAEAARVGNALQALATVTQALPDDSYLTQFGLHARKLTLTGRSAAAARLIGAFAADPALRDPAFAAPVTRAGGDRGDQFTIRAELAR